MHTTNFKLTQLESVNLSKRKTPSDPLNMLLLLLYKYNFPQNLIERPRCGITIISLTPIAFTMFSLKIPQSSPLRHVDFYQHDIPHVLNGEVIMINHDAYPPLMVDLIRVIP